MALEDTIIMIFSIIPIYLTIFFLIPAYFKRKKWFRFFGGLVLLFLITNVLRSLLILATLHLRSIPFYFEYEFSKWAFGEYVSFDRFIFGSNAWSVYLAFAYVLIRDWVINEKIKTRLESEKVSMELAFLKAQIDPHFLFNTLNNLYALALEEKAPRTADTVTKLGTLMRYSLHDSQADRILLSKEIDYIEKYIELEKLRMTPATKLDVRFNFTDGGLTGEKIAPMILMPFIENAFKHGITSTGGSQIGIGLSLSKKLLVLEVWNSLHHKPQPESGIGLSNVKNRLQLIYPGKHRLTSETRDDSYHVRLEIDLSQ
jgi:hypothetical protein